MNGKSFRWLVLGSLLFTLSISACSEEAPLGPESEPLCGKWVGSFTSPINGSTKAGSLQYTVRADGLASGTGYTWYSMEGIDYAEVLFMEVEVFPDGALSGEARWLLYILGYGTAYAEGTVTGSLDPGAFTGSGTASFPSPEGDISIPWTADKVTR